MTVKYILSEKDEPVVKLRLISDAGSIVVVACQGGTTRGIMRFLPNGMSKRIAGDPVHGLRMDGSGIIIEEV